MVKLVDTQASGACEVSSWRFESSSRHDFLFITPSMISVTLIAAVSYKLLRCQADLTIMLGIPNHLELLPLCHEH